MTSHDSSPAADAELAARKHELRELMRRRRDGLTPEARQEQSRRIAERVLQLPELARAGEIFCYISVGSEVDTRELLRKLLEADRIVAVPRLNRRIMEPVPVRCVDGLADGAFRVPAPPRHSPPLGRTPAVTLMPGLGFDAAGHRLGQGGGFYDRFLADHPETLPIMLAFDVQELDAVPVAGHDQPAPVIVTATRVLRC